MFTQPIGAGTKINETGPDAKERAAHRGLLCFAAGIVCFVVGATLVTARVELPEFSITIGKVIFLGWPLLTLAAAALRFWGLGARDWLFWTALAVLLIPAAMVGLVFYW